MTLDFEFQRVQTNENIHDIFVLHIKKEPPVQEVLF